MTYDTHTARVQLSHAIESAIELLDVLGGDPDLEPEWDGDPDSDLEPDADSELSGDEDEPSLGATAAVDQTRWGKAAGNFHNHDLEVDDSDLEPSLGSEVPGYAYDAELDRSDDEPWLGSYDRPVDQTQWAGVGGMNCFGDAEVDRSDFEPSMGSPAGGIGNQEHWAQGRDAEENGDEQDEDGDERDRDGDESDYSGNGPSEDDPFFPPTSLEMLNVEVAETCRVASWLADHVRRLQDAERLGMLS